MTEKRFEVGESENQYNIFDNEGPDDYYHLGNDERDVKALCKLLNELHEKNQLEEIQALKAQNKELKEAIGNLIVKEFKITKEDIIKGKGGDATDFSSVIDEFFNNEVSISEIQVELETDKNKITKKGDYCNRNCIFYNAEYETRNNDTIVFKDCELRNSEIHEEYPLNFCEDYEK